MIIAAFIVGVVVGIVSMAVFSFVTEDESHD